MTFIYGQAKSDKNIIMLNTEEAVSVRNIPDKLKKNEDYR